MVVGETVTAVPLVAGILPGEIRPVPLLNTGVRVVEVPDVIDEVATESEVAIGPGTEPPPALASPPPPPPPLHAKERTRATLIKSVWNLLV